jgi:hypothetical protein
MKETLITSHLRFNAEGAVERVSWLRLADGTKRSQVEHHKPSAVELQRMAESMHAQTWPDNRKWT